MLLKLKPRKQEVDIMKKISFLSSMLTLCLAQSISLAVASDFMEGIQLAASDDQYGCCLIKVDSSTGALWEYTDDTSFSNCYGWAQMVGNPFEYHKDKKFEFYRSRKCHLIKKYEELTPSQYTPREGNS
jgi:hypothetical protein